MRGSVETETTLEDGRMPTAEEIELIKRGRDGAASSLLNGAYPGLLRVGGKNLCYASTGDQ
jgi:hypothetical protein